MEVTNNRENLLKKIGKLKALSECKTGNVNEAATAAAMLSKLMLEHQIEEIELGEVETTQTVEASDELFREETANPSWQVSLFASLARLWFCKPYTQNIGKKKHKKLRIIGVKEDVENVRSLFSFITKEIESLVDLQNLRTCKEKNDFKLGAVHGINGKLVKERAQTLEKVSESTAMVLVNRKEAAVLALTEPLNLKATAFTRRAPQRDAYGAGVVAGRSITIGDKLGAGTAQAALRS